uniref:HTH cro/C1-type domain-containing protein n=1 Tax=Chryseobacterium endophyticum TaxID=1854762 RepID=A0AAU6WSR0_9FLAO
MTIAERIRLYRQQKGLSQAELAEKSLVNKKAFPDTSWEAASHLPMRLKISPML